MNKYFDERVQQVEVGSIVAFGIPIDSRYKIAGEISEMLNFTAKCALKDVHQFIKSVFYDSKANICFLEFHSNLKEGSTEADVIEKCALNSLDQFQFFGIIGHRHFNIS